MLYTSYFAFVNDIDPKYLVSIAGRSPEDFKGAQYKKLAPKYEWWKEWKDYGLSNNWYKNKYYLTVLDSLNPEEVIEEIGDKKILLCYEHPEKFCHRHLVAEWMEHYNCNPVHELTLRDKLSFTK